MIRLIIIALNELSFGKQDSIKKANLQSREPYKQK